MGQQYWVPCAFYFTLLVWYAVKTYGTTLVFLFVLVEACCASQLSITRTFQRSPGYYWKSGRDGNHIYGNIAFCNDYLMPYSIFSPSTASDTLFWLCSLCLKTPLGKSPEPALVLGGLCLA